MIGEFLHWEATEVKNNGRKTGRRRKVRDRESGEGDAINEKSQQNREVKRRAFYSLVVWVL